MPPYRNVPLHEIVNNLLDGTGLRWYAYRDQAIVILPEAAYQESVSFQQQFYGVVEDKITHQTQPDARIVGGRSSTRGGRYARHACRACYGCLEW
ncbi:MAG: hypothetical protein R2795_09195 [Saprospiraceae bacterium]